MNVERSVRGYLTQALAPVPVYTETTATTAPPYVAITRTGGPGRPIDQDVDIEVRVVHTTRPGMWALADDVDRALRALAAAATPDGLYVDDVAVTFGFADDRLDGVRGALATYTVTVRVS